MFFHNFKYAIISLIKSKTALLWTLAFPIALATFMYVAFSGILEEDESMAPISVAVVESETTEMEEKNAGQQELLAVLETLAEPGKDQMLTITKAQEEKAKKLLQKQTVEGIFYVEQERLVIGENSINSTILSMILEQYIQKKAVIMELWKEHPEQIAEAIKAVTNPTSSYEEQKTTDGCQNIYYNYFYAIFAMSCLFASFASVEKISKIQANTSALGMRRSLSPNSKMITILSEYSALWLVQFVVELIALAYMTVLGIDFGDKYPAIALALFVGSGIGLSLGVIIGAISRLKENVKIGIAVSVGMALSVMADLCVPGIKDAVEHHVPILNRINPAVLLTDCFYSLNVYDNYERFGRNIFILSVMSVVLLLISFFMVRRNRYASL